MDRSSWVDGQVEHRPTLGVLMLDSRFPRPPGDVGNALTWPFPVRYRVVSGALPDLIVRDLDRADWLGPFLDGARELERSGVDLITTSCGFLALFQTELQRELRVPILTSSLLQVPLVATLLPLGKRVGILTIEAASLTPDHLQAAGIPPNLRPVIAGIDQTGGYFSGQILGNRPELDLERAGEEHERAARDLVQRFPDVGAIVLECTNMPPYAQRMRAASGLPIFDLTTLVRWAMSGILPDPT